MQGKTTQVGSCSPEDLLAGFAKGRILVWIACSVGIHVVLIGLLSIGYIRDRWNPKAADARKAAAAAARQELEKPAPPAAAKTAAPASKATAASEATKRTAGPAAPSPVREEQVSEGQKNVPEAKAITETAKPGEKPVASDVSLDDAK